MTFGSLSVSPAELERATGWRSEDRGLCRGDVCVAFDGSRDPVDLRAVADALGMPLVHDATAGIAELGPPSGGRALSSATAPDLALPDVDGRTFHLSSLRGQKVLLIAWAPW